MGRGRGFGGADLGGFTGNFRSGGPAYHSTDEINFEIQQWSELAGFLSTHPHFVFTTTAFRRRIATERAEHPRRSRITLDIQWEQYTSGTWRSRWS